MHECISEYFQIIIVIEIVIACLFLIRTKHTFKRLSVHELVETHAKLINNKQYEIHWSIH